MWVVRCLGLESGYPQGPYRRERESPHINRPGKQESARESYKLFFTVTVGRKKTLRSAASLIPTEDRCFRLSDDGMTQELCGLQFQFGNSLIGGV